jgi:hypothetical protein
MHLLGSIHTLLNPHTHEPIIFLHRLEVLCKFCEVLLLHPLQGAAVEQELDLDDCRSSCRSCVNRRSVIIWLSLVLGLHT